MFRILVKEGLPVVRNTFGNRHSDRTALKRALRRILPATLLIMALSLPSALSEKEFRPLPIDLSAGAPVDAVFARDVFVYEDPTIRAERIAPTHDPATMIQYYAVDVQIKDASQLRTASADPESFTSIRRIPPENIARRMNAVFALNGDYCTDDSVENSKYVMRQGIIFRNTVDTKLDMLLIDEDGDLHIVQGGPELETMDKTHIDGKKVYNAFQFGPGLVIDGKPVDEEYILDENHSPKYAEPAGGALRMCLVQVGPLHYKAIASRYHTNLKQLQELILSVAPDCQNAYVLDGGGSARLVFLGKAINTDGGDRPLSDIIYFASAWSDKE